MSTTPYSDTTNAKPATSTKARERKVRRPSVAAILREAYRLHVRDRETRLAVKACLRMA
ncbi:hypothetical protein ACXR0O_21965 [Verrucomicrobiota bacterium sgz303538]